MSVFEALLFAIVMSTVAFVLGVRMATKSFARALPTMLAHASSKGWLNCMIEYDVVPKMGEDLSLLQEKALRAAQGRPMHSSAARETS